MTDAFEERKKGFEAKYTMDEERNFRITSKRDKLFGQWAAEHMGKSKDEADSYALALVEADLTTHGDDELIAKVLGDIQASGDTEMTEGRLQIRLQKCRDEAERLVREE